MSFYKGIHTVFMLRPSHFGFNRETKYTNPFQYDLEADAEMVKVKATEEFDDMVATLQSEGIKVVVYDDQAISSPDAVFIDSWLSVFPDGKAALYPVYGKNRRIERRSDIIDDLRGDANVNDVLDLTFFEKENRYLESTSSVVFDHQSKIAYASISARTDEKVINHLCQLIGYDSFSFNAVDLLGRPFSHTSTVMTLGRAFALVCLDAIEDSLERSIIRKKLEQSGKEIIEISIDQVMSFVANSMEVMTPSGGSKLIISRTAYSALKPLQLERISRYTDMVQVNIPIIERVGGGSISSIMLGVGN